MKSYEKYFDIYGKINKGVYTAYVTLSRQKKTDYRLPVTDRRTARQTDGRTHPHIELFRRN